MILDSKVICCLGDSITANGRYMAEVFEHLARRYPEKKIRMYNCGVSGDTAPKALKRLDTDVLRYSPDTVSIMLGVNDIGTWLYMSTCQDPDAEQQKKERIAQYADAMEKIVQRLTEEGIRVILCTPVPYDDYSVEGQENGYCNRGLHQCRDIVLALAEKYKTHIVDFMGKMTPMLPEGIFNDDRVHPNVVGYHRMANIFMEDVGLIPDGTDDYSMNEQNQCRYEVEGILRNLWFIESWIAAAVGENASIEARKAECRRRIPQEVEWLQQRFQRYIDCIDDKESYEEQLVRETDAMYSAGD